MTNPLQALWPCCAGEESGTAELFSALADPTRLILLWRLLQAQGELSVSELSDCCGIHLSGVSRHLAQLRQAQIIDARKEGRTVFYRLRAEPLASTLTALAEAVSSQAQPSEATTET